MPHVGRPRFCIACGGALVRTDDDRPREAPPYVCSACGNRVWEDPKVAAAAIVLVAGEVLLIRRAQNDAAHGLWILPGGFVDKGETVPAAARREVSEELGLTVTLTGLVGVYSYDADPVVTVVYRGEVEPGTEHAVTPGAEALEVARFERDAIPWADLGFASTRDALRELFGR